MSLDRGNRQRQIDDLRRRLEALESGEEPEAITIEDVQGLQDALNDFNSRLEALETED